MMMDRMYIELDCEGSDNWKKWIKENGVTYNSIHSFTMCGGIRLDGVSHFPHPKPEYIRYEVAK